MNTFRYFLFFLLFLSSCSYRTGDLTLVAPGLVNLENTDLTKSTVMKNVVGRSTRVYILGIPLGLPSLEEAVEEALEKGGGDLLTDVSIYDRVTWTIFIIGQYGIEVRGDVVKTRSN